MSKKIPRVLELGSMQEFLEMSDEDLKKARTSGPLMAAMINKLWRAVGQLAGERNKEAAAADGFKKELAEYVEDVVELEEELTDLREQLLD